MNESIKHEMVNKCERFISELLGLPESAERLSSQTPISQQEWLVMRRGVKKVVPWEEIVQLGHALDPLYQPYESMRSKHGVPPLHEAEPAVYASEFLARYAPSASDANSRWAEPPYSTAWRTIWRGCAQQVLDRRFPELVRLRQAATHQRQLEAAINEELKRVQRGLSPLPPGAQRALFGKLIYDNTGQCLV